MEPISFQDVRRNGWVIMGNEVYDLTKFVPHHRGGKAIKQMQGMDATLPMINAHGLQGELGIVPKGLRVGSLDTATLDPVDRDLREMQARYQAQGLFRYKAQWLALDVARMLGLFAVAALALSVSRPAAFVAFTAAILNVIWWVHDVCHDSVFADRASAKHWAEVVSVLFVGTPAIAYHYAVHRLHHGFTNVIGADHALETGPVVWDERMSERSPAWFRRVQAFAWFFLILPLTYPLFLAVSIGNCARKKEFTKIALVVLRWLVVWKLFAGESLLFLGPTFCASYLLVFFSGLNHFHKPMSGRLDLNFARSVMKTTQNLTNTNGLWTWFTGGLNFHIEHHLFATMPRHNYRVVAPEVRAFCERHGFEYSTCTFGEAVGSLWCKLSEPFGREERSRGHELSGIAALESVGG